VERDVLIFKSSFIEFYRSQEHKVQQKIEFVLDLIRHERAVPAKFFKRLHNTQGLYEVRVITPQKSIRILCFLDEGNLVILTNGFVKKSQKTPREEIEKAKRLRNEYYSNQEEG
jgi:phage-related protein